MNGTLRWILDHRWAIVESSLDAIVEVVSRADISSEEIAKAVHGSQWENYLTDDNKPVNPAALEATNYPILEGTRRVSQAGNVAIVPVIGPIFPRSNLFTCFSGGTTLQSLSYDFNVALESHQIDSIIMNIDSPGGEVTGIAEFAEMMFQGRNRKKVISYIYGWGASAGYWIASAGGEVVINQTAEAGSIGVVAGFTSTKEQDKMEGIKKIEIISSQSPNKRPDPETKTGKSQIQVIVDNLADVFISAVAKNRGVKPEAVAENFGQGKMFVGQDAVDHGLADRLGSLEALIEEQKNNSTHSLITIGGSMDLTELKSKHAAVYEEAKAEGVAEANTGIDAKVKAAGVTAAEDENTRIKNIESINAPGMEAFITEKKFDRSQTKDSVSSSILDKQAETRKNAKEGLDKDGKKLAEDTEDVGNGATEEDGDDAERASLVKAGGEAANAYR